MLGHQRRYRADPDRLGQAGREERAGIAGSGTGAGVLTAYVSAVGSDLAAMPRSILIDATPGRRLDRRIGGQSGEDGVERGSAYLDRGWEWIAEQHVPSSWSPANDLGDVRSPARGRGPSPASAYPSATRRRRRSGTVPPA
jgi:hypothetical protein